MRYAQGGGLAAEGRRRREQIPLEAAKRFEQRAPSAVIAVELRVSERSVRRWRQAWQAAGETGLASRGQAAQCRPDEQQLAALDVALEAGPLAAGWEDQRWTLARVRDLVAGKFRVQYTMPGIWYLLQRRGWTCQLGARRAIERDDGAVEVRKKETWPRIKDRGGPRRLDRLRRRVRPVDEAATVPHLGTTREAATPSTTTSLSALHAGLQAVRGLWYAKDLGSTKSTLLNGRRIVSTQLLKKRHKIKTGRTVMVVVST